MVVAGIQTGCRLLLTGVSLRLFGNSAHCIKMLCYLGCLVFIHGNVRSFVSFAEIDGRCCNRVLTLNTLL